jgi:hypothetical protein
LEGPLTGRARLTEAHPRLDGQLTVGLVTNPV